MSTQQSFVVRCWRLGSREPRIEIEHVQSGQRRLAHSTKEALEWIDGFASEPEQQRQAVTLSVTQERAH